jgi:transposase
VSAQTASRWHRDGQAGGRDALAGAARLGRTPRLSDQQLAEIEAALLDGPQTNGFSTDMWTPARVADVIERSKGQHPRVGPTSQHRTGQPMPEVLDDADHTGLRL